MKRTLSLLLCIALVMGLLPVTAFAAEDAPETSPAEVSEDVPAPIANPDYSDAEADTWIEITWGTEENALSHWKCSGGQIVEDESDSLPQTVTYDDSTHTLTLENATLNTIDIDNWGTTAFTIVVKGANNTVKPVNADDQGNGADGIFIGNCHDVTIKGEGSGAKLTVEPTPGEGQVYGTPLILSDAYISDNPEGDDFHPYPDGSLTIEGVELVLTNNETGIKNAEQGHASAFNALGNVTLKNGAKITAKGLQGIDAKGNFTIGAGCEVNTDALNVSGFDGYDEGGGNVRKLTVDGTLNITGALKDTTETDWWWPSLWIRESAQLVLNSTGVVTVHSTYHGTGEAISLDHTDWNDETAPEYLVPAEAHINGGTLTVEDVHEYGGIYLSTGTKWVQTAGTVTVKAASNASNGPTGIAVNGDAHAKSDGNNTVGPASFEQSGGTFTVDFSNLPDECNGVVGVVNSGKITLSGSATFNVKLAGASSWASGVQIRKDTISPEEGVETIPEQTTPTMTVKGSAKLTVDMSGLKGDLGNDEEGGAWFAGVNVENSTFNIEGGTVTVKLPGTDKTAGSAVGVNVSSSTLDITGGKVEITENGGTFRELIGISLGNYNSEDENSPAPVFTMNGGEVAVTLNPDMQGYDYANLHGISIWDEGSTASITGGKVTLNVTGTLSDKGEHIIWSIESSGESLTIGKDATVDITGGFIDNCPEEEVSGWIAFYGIAVREGSTYTQGGSVTVNLTEDSFPNDSYGLDAEGHCTVTVSGSLTIGDGFLQAIYIRDFSTLEVANGAHIVYKPTNSDNTGCIRAENNSGITVGGGTIDLSVAGRGWSNGIDLRSYSTATVNGGTINIDMPRTPNEGEGGLWLVGGIFLEDNGALVVNGGKININQGDRTGLLEENYTSLGIVFWGNGYMRVSGGEVNIKAAIPVYWEGDSFSGQFSLADGVCAMYTDGTNNGHEVTVLNDTIHVPAYEDPNPDYSYDAYEYSIYAYLSGPDAYPKTADEYTVNRNNEFNVKIAKQNAEPSAPVKQEYSGLLELVNPGTITAGQSVTLRMTATLPDGTDELTLAIDNGTIERGSVSVNGAVPTSANNVTYSSDGKSVTLTINSGDIVRFNVIPGNGENTVTATVSEETKEVTFTAQPLTLELPTATKTATITVSGVTAAEQEVTIYVDGTAQTPTVKSNKAGVWSTTVTLTSTGEHEVYATAGGNTSDKKTVVYNPDVPTINSLTVTNWIHGRTSADPNVETSFTIDYEENSVDSRYYIYWPELTRFVFTVTVTSGSVNIREIRVICTDWKGDKETVTLTYDSESYAWIGEGYFCGLGPDGKEHIVPEHFMVEYVVDIAGERKTFCTADSNKPSSCGDPSGYVYEGLKTNPLSGVTTTLYKATNTNGDGSVVWNDAGAYDQSATLTTNELGQYLWMVPNGYWQVKYEKTDYKTEESAWMVVPPVRTGVNQNLTSTKEAEATVTFNEELHEYVISFNRPVQVADVMRNLEANANVPGADRCDFVYVTPVDAGWAETNDTSKPSTLCATTFTADIAAYKTVVVSEDESYEEPVAIPEGTDITVSCADGTKIKTYMGTESKIEAQVKAPERTYYVSVENGSGSGYYVPGTEVTVKATDRSGYEFAYWDCYSEVTPDGFTPNANPATFTMPACDVTLTAQYKEVETPPESSGSSSGGGGGQSSSFRPSVPSRPGVLSPRDTGVSMTLDVSSGIAFIQGFPDGTVAPDKALTRAEAVQMIYRLVADKPAAAANPFKDVKDGDWFSEAALGLAAMGVIKGQGSADIFAPNKIMTRAEFAAVCARLAVETNSPKTFADVPANHWAAKEIGTAAAYGWINGRDGTHFDPNTGITRAEAAKIINCMIGRAPVTGGSDVTFKDLSPNHWAYGEILAAAQGN